MRGIPASCGARGQGHVAQWAWFVEKGLPRARAGLGDIGGGEKSALEGGLHLQPQTSRGRGEAWPGTQDWRPRP